MIHLDGSHGEGGGELIRTALAMSALTQQPFRLSNARFGTRFPGLDAEEVTIIRAMAWLTSAHVEGADLGRPEFTFAPKNRPVALRDEVPSTVNGNGRGPNALITLSALAPVLARTGGYSTVRATGETYGMNALSYDPFAESTVTAWREFGLYTFPRLETAGFGRDQEGVVELDVEPSALNGVIAAERGNDLRIFGRVCTHGVNDSVADRAIHHAKTLAKSIGKPLEIEHRRVGSTNPGIYVSFWVNASPGTGSGSAIGSRNLRAEQLVQGAMEDLLEWMDSKSTYDPYVADQILLPAILCGEECSFSVSRLTSRFLTKIWVAKQFAPLRITVRGNEGSRGVVTITPSG